MDTLDAGNGDVAFKKGWQLVSRILISQTSLLTFRLFLLLIARPPLTDLRVTAVLVGDLEDSECVPYLAGILETQETQFPGKINTDLAKTLANLVVESLGGNFENLHGFAKLA
jgi:hypothetical protein